MKLHVAGIGASAGGLEAMLALFSRLRPTGRVAYLVAQHMGEDTHTDLLVRLLSRDSALPVVLGRQGLKLEADTIYVIPAGHDGVVEGGTLRLQAPGPDNLSTPSVNVLFTSLARCCGTRAIGIVLSGTGSDGRTGCRELKAHGGLTLAQAPGEARFSGMPGVSIEAGVVDRVLTAQEIAGAIAGLFPGPKAPAPVSGELDELQRLILEETGVDFRHYKEETLLRRLEKRKEQLALTEDYLSYARRHPEELRILQERFLVSVSSFFRDQAAFRVLATALEGLVGPARVWVPGCASGEEVYSLAILLLSLPARPIRIVGTDLSPEALKVARRGAYRRSAFREMDSSLLPRYFTRKSEELFEVGPALREVVEFEQRDVFAGPPMDGLALVSCRNLLIYLKAPRQDLLLASIHKALLPQGLLFLGPAETLGFASAPLFTAVDLQHCLYRKRG